MYKKFKLKKYKKKNVGIFKTKINIKQAAHQRNTNQLPD